jgi:hypothetical protein
MFDVDDAIAEWRRKLRASGIESPALLDELESHLRDDVEMQIGGGTTAQEAFAAGVARMGEATLLQDEFAKVGWPIFSRERVRDAFLTFAGIPHSTLTTDIIAMTTPSEPRWTTYTKAAVFLAPALGLWTIVALFFVPKLQHICHESGLAVPAVCRAPWIIANHTFAICVVPVLLLALLEWRWNEWPKYRRASVGGVVFFFNAAVLFLLAVMVLLALLAAPALLHHV